MFNADRSIPTRHRHISATFPNKSCVIFDFRLILFRDYVIETSDYINIDIFYIRPSNKMHVTNIKKKKNNNKMCYTYTYIDLSIFWKQLFLIISNWCFL